MSDFRLNLDDLMGFIAVIACSAVLMGWGAFFA